VTRAAGEIGAGLEPAREPRRIRAGERIHVLGAAGAGASAAALHASWAGAAVDGCDAGGPSPYTPALDEAAIPLSWEHDPAHVVPGRSGRPDRLAVTKALTSIAPDHPELVAARRAGVPLEPWQQAVADAAVGRTLVGVAGTHGKSTTAGWLVHVLVAAGMDPSAFVGALLPTRLVGRRPATARQGRGATFVVEADEYAGNFDPFRPAVAVVTSAEWDHPDVFADRDAVVGAFEGWLRGATRGGARPPTLVANVSDPGVAQLVDRLVDWPGALIAITLVDDRTRHGAGLSRVLSGVSDRFVTAGGPTRVIAGRASRLDPDGTTLELAGSGLGTDDGMVRLATAGRHNAANALGVLGACHALGLELGPLLEGVGMFEGVGRRLERKGEEAGVVVYDDYGHHPTAISATIAAVRQREPGRRLWAVYEPLTYHRTAAMLEPFADALAAADAVVVAEIWPGRDRDRTVVSAGDLASAVGRVAPAIVVAAPGSVEATGAWLAHEVRAGDAVLVMGGGRSYRIAELLLEALAGR